MAALNIFGLRHRLQVRRVHTSSNPAEMVQLQPDWDRAYRKPVGENVGLDFGALVAESSIAAWLHIARPQPAWAEAWCVLRNRAVAVDVGPKRVGRVAVRHSTNDTATVYPQDLDAVLALLR